jgi:hypothetical protein
MRSFEKDLIFWYGLNKIAGEDLKLRHAIAIDREYLFHLANVTYFGIQQYTLYTGTPLTVIDDTEMNKYSNYVIENYETIRKIRFRYYDQKVFKIKIQNEDEKIKAKEIIEKLFIPFFNKYCFRTMTSWKHLIPTYIAGMIFNFEYDINHVSNDKKLKTSSIYPFLFTLNIVNIQDKENLFKRVHLYFDRKKILKKYSSGRSWKPKEEEYLKETLLLLNNEEEWNTFLANFMVEKWDSFNIDERYKTLFQLSKVTCILMKDKITSVTMLGNGTEEFELLRSYLPLFIYSDKIINDQKQIPIELQEKYGKTCAPFGYIYLNANDLFEYVSTKDNHVVVDEEKLKLMTEIIWTIILKLRIMKLNHKYLPEIVNLQIEQRRKLIVDILDLFVPCGEGKFKSVETTGEFNIENFYILDQDIRELKGFDDDTRSIFRSKLMFKIARGVSYILGMNLPTAKNFNYDIFEIIKYVLTIMAPHPMDRTIVTEEFMEDFKNKFSKILEWYGSLHGTTKEKYRPFFELPFRLYSMDEKEREHKQNSSPNDVKK